jgi:hypothetical protein
MGSFLKKISFVLMYCAYLVLFFLAVDYVFFWRPFVGELREHDNLLKRQLITHEHVDRITAMRLGRISPIYKKSSFVHFSQSKEQNIIRVCAFGDSFTYGTEVDQTHDFPSLLQQLFHKNDIENIEVINFGHGGHGFHQAYIMWDSVGRRFDCDYILLGPSCFQANRDTRFNHASLRNPYYVHSRYIIDGNDVKLVDAIGDNYQELFENYFKFTPRWKYLRYDRNPPSILQALIPKGRTLKNIFYYYDGPENQEAFETYEILLRKLSESDAQVVLGHKKQEIVDIGKRIKKNNFASVKFNNKIRSKFPYIAPKGHNSAWGNQLVAESFYAQIVDQEENKLTILKTSDIEREGKALGIRHKRPLSSYDRIDVIFEEIPVGFFVTASGIYKERGEGSPTDLKDSETVSFLAFKNATTSLLDAAFVPLDFTLQPGSDVVLRIRNASKTEDHLLGKVRMVDRNLNIGVVDLPRDVFKTDNKIKLLGNNKFPKEKLIRNASKISILVDNSPVLKGLRQKNSIVLMPVKGILRRIRAGESSYVDIHKLKSSGIIKLVLQHPEDGVVGVPIAKWEKTTVEIPLAEKSLKKISLITSDKVMMR